jgi:hypothetical protein
VSALTQGVASSHCRFLARQRADGNRSKLTVIGVAAIELASARIKTDHPRRDFPVLEGADDLMARLVA